jgi:signal peptidase
MNAEAQRNAVCCELVHDVAHSAGEVRLRVAGASMLPAIWPGDVITVRGCNLTELQPGHIALYRRDGKLTAHRIQELTSDHLIARGDSVPCFDPPVRANEIVGKVVSISRDGKILPLEQTFWHRAVSTILRHSDFLLRVTLYLGRRLRPFWDPRSPWTRSSTLPAWKR